MSRHNRRLLFCMFREGVNIGRLRMGAEGQSRAHPQGTGEHAMMYIESGRAEVVGIKTLTWNGKVCFCIWMIFNALCWNIVAPGPRAGLEGISGEAAASGDDADWVFVRGGSGTYPSTGLVGPICSSV